METRARYDAANKVLRFWLNETCGTAFLGGRTSQEVYLPFSQTWCLLLLDGRRMRPECKGMEVELRLHDGRTMCYRVVSVSVRMMPIHKTERAGKHIAVLLGR